MRPPAFAIMPVISTIGFLRDIVTPEIEYALPLL